MIKEYQKLFSWLLVFFDIVFIVFSFFILKNFLFTFMGTIPVESLLLIIPAYLISYQVLGLYSSQRTKQIKQEGLKIFQSTIFVFICTLLFFLAFALHFPIESVLGFLILTFVLLSFERILIRIILRTIRKKGFNLKHFLVIGSEELGRNFAKKIKDYNYFGYTISGFLTDTKTRETIYGFPVLGKISNLKKIISDRFLDGVIIALKFREYPKIKSIISTCDKKGIPIFIVPDKYSIFQYQKIKRQFGEIQLIPLRDFPLDNGLNKLVKRLTDIVLSFLFIILFSPVLLTVAIVIKLNSKGPVIFKQIRIGLNRKKFVMYKFRSIGIEHTEKGERIRKKDPRKTKWGNFIRKTSIDELPQLFNVLKGDMSLVGPRPEMPSEMQFVGKVPHYMIKHYVKQGMTGWAQVNGWRGRTSIKKRVEHDLYYIQFWTFWLDIKILFLTIFKGFVNKNAY